MKKIGVIIVISLLAVFAFSVIYTSNFKMTGFAISTQSNEQDFNLGDYENTEYSSGVILSSGQTSGAYTSQIFDAGNEAVWNNISYSSLTPGVDFLYAVDVSSDVWNSADSGVNWLLAKDDFNGEIVNAADTGFFNSSGSLFVIANQKVWTSSDGIVWTKINDDYNGAAEGQNALASTADKNDVLYITEGGRDVWSSSDSGVTWNKVAAATFGTKDAIGLVVDSSNTLFSVDVGADIWKSSDSGATWTKINDDYNGADGNDATAMAIDSNDIIYILDSTSVWKSSDLGLNWTKQTSDFDPLDAHLGISMASDSENNIYILDSNEDVYISTDGISWTKQAENINAGNGNAKVFSSTQKSTSLIFQIRNCSSADCSDGIWQNADLNSINLTSRYFQYKVTFTSPDSGTTPKLSSVSIDYSLVNTAPVIILMSPSDGDSYGYDTGIKLNFSVSDDNIDSCWYKIDSGSNVDLPGCNNVTFDSSEGSHTIIIYANDTLGEESSDSASFNIQVGAPTIILNSPLNGTYINSGNIEFEYTATDIDLDYCELWGDFDREFKKNQTSSPVSGIEDSFLLVLPEGNYKWNIKCYDSAGHSAFNGNKTFYIDATAPSISITQPSGAKTSRDIDSAVSVSDNSPVSCVYNVYRGASIEIANTSFDCFSASFSVTIDADFTFNVYANDSAGNKNAKTSSFSVSTSVSPVADPGSSSGSASSGGGGSVLMPNVKIEDIGDIIVYPGEERTLELKIKNTGLKFLNDCKIIGDSIESDDIKDIGVGEIANFMFALIVPEQGQVSDILLECIEKKEKIGLNILIIKPDLNIELYNIRLESSKELSVNYSLKSAMLKTITLVFSVFNKEGGKISEKEENVKIGDNSIVLDVSKAQNGMIKISVAKKGEKDALIEEFFVYDKGSVTGFASKIFEGNVSYIGLIVFLFILGVFLIVKRIIKAKKKKK